MMSGRSTPINRDEAHTLPQPNMAFMTFRKLPAYAGVSWRLSTPPE
ncbi:hypothetical protein C8J31_10511 [Rhizobium sp. PP-CC-2G-626]|nr:hypothetical protein C8J31_10511 [Rhizobium sp. PP-CC-2G-626]